MLEELLPLVKRVAQKMMRSMPPHTELGDLEQHGVFGVMRAIDNYDPSSGVYFETYAVASIRSAIMDSVRALDWAPRSLRRRQREIDRTATALETQLQRTPTDDEIATKLGRTSQEVARTRQETAHSWHRSLDELEQDDDEHGSHHPHLDQRDDPARTSATNTTYATLVAWIASLPPKEQTIVALYYFEGMTLGEAAELLNMPESRASQLHTRTILALREQMMRLLRR